MPVTDDSKATIASAVNTISHLATLPEVTLRVIELVENPSSTVQELHDVVARDPALCSRMLKVVNSAFYGRPRKVGSIDRAISLLGLNAVKNIAVAASLAKLSRNGELSPQFSARDLWLHSFAVGMASKLIASEVKHHAPEEAFLAGLMHDIGLLVQMQSNRDGLVRVLNRMTFKEDGTPIEDMRQVEREILGGDHEMYGTLLCEAWKFPSALVHVTGQHHEPLQVPKKYRQLTCTVYVADRLAAEHGIGFRVDLPFLNIDPDVLDELKLTKSQLEAVRDALPMACEGAMATFR